MKTENRQSAEALKRKINEANLTADQLEYLLGVSKAIKMGVRYEINSSKN